MIHRQGNDNSPTQYKGALFKLPNGKHLKYEYSRNGIKVGSQDTWTKARNCEEFWRTARSPKKEQLPKLGLWSSRSNQHLLAIDIDKLPEGFLSFEELYNKLLNTLDKVAIVLRSPSGKVKVLFLVEVYGGIIPTDSSIKSVLNQLLPSDLNCTVDPQGTKLCFVNESMARIISERLPYLPVFLSMRVSGPTGAVRRDEAPKEPRFYRGPIPDSLLVFQKHYKSKLEPSKEKFLRYLLASPNLIWGLDLPITHLGKLMGTTPTSVSTWIKWLIQNRWLQLVSGKYAKGKKARRFKANGKLLSFLKILYPTHTDRQTPPPPSVIRDGEWNDAGWSAIVHFQNRSKVLDWFYNIPGNDLKGREKKILHQLQEWERGRLSKGS